MVDTSKYITGEFITPEKLKRLETEFAVVLTEGTEETGKYGDKLILDIEINKERFRYSLNKRSIKLISKAYGKDSKDWVGKKIKLKTFMSIIDDKEKEVLMGYPAFNPEPTEKVE